MQERLVLLLAVLLRVLVGLSSYSGAGDSPKFGDYEAQRHWMEITVNLPPSQWYTESEYNNVTYWPLDYPPLSGYQSYLHGHLVKHWEPAAVALHTSHGYETPSSKRLMRLTVLLSDVLVFFPAALAVTRVLYGPQASPRRALSLAALLLNPALIIIDHGHFQYNCISLGLALAGAAAIGAGRRYLGSVLFCAALSHKQMSLYYAPAFFAHLLGRCLGARGLMRKVGGVLALGLLVIGSFSAMWAPWLTSVQSLEQVVRRIFPLRRGLYEDYVANWWCASSVVLKWKQLVPADRMVAVCAGATLAAALPSMLQQMWRPSTRGLLMGMANSAAAFYMLSYQVHEKSVLLPLVPLMALAADQPTVAAWMPLIGLVSMYPLLDRDGLTLPYFALALVWGGTMLAWLPALAPSVGDSKADGSGRATAARGTTMQRLVSGLVWVLGVGFVLAALALHIAQRTYPPPENLPWLYDRGFITLGFAGLALGMLHVQHAQWRLPPQATTRWQEHDETVAKKQL